MTGDRDMLAFRHGYYELFVSLFSKEPAGDLLLRLPNGIAERIEAARNLDAVLGQGWEEMHRFLSQTPSAELAESVADEYTRLFIGPYGPKVNPYESFYFTGRLFDRPLADLRGFLKTVGIEKQEDYAEPEDSLAFELEVMRWLTAKQLASSDDEEENRRIGQQTTLLKDHLLIWGPTCARDIEQAKGASFYRGAAMILRAFLEMENQTLRDWGVEKPISLEEARNRYGAFRQWKGPTFDGNPGREQKS
jgi:TorA maturation chaperone TorD